METLLADAATRTGDDRENVWELKPELCLEYDPTFPRLARPDHERAAERVVAFRARLPKSKNPRPVVGPMPPCHASFVQTRRELLRAPTVVAALRGALARGAAASSEGGSGRDRAGERELEGVALHVATLCVHDAKEHGRGLAWGADVVASFLDLKERGGFNAPLQDEGLEWVVREAALLDGDCASLATARAARARSPASPDAPSSEKASADKRRRRARERALAKMKAQQAKFAKTLDDEEAAAGTTTRDRGSSFDAPASPAPPPQREYSSVDQNNAPPVVDEDAPTCIMCRAGADAENPLGCVAFAQRSSVVARSCQPCAGPTKWVATRSCRARARPPGATRAAAGATVKRFRRGDAVTVTRVRGEIARVDCDGRDGWVSLRSSPSDARDALVPKADGAWRRWGRTRVHVAACGHHVHYGCWDACGAPRP